MRRACALVAALVLGPGCALLSKSKPLGVKWYTPDRVVQSLECRPARPGQTLLLGRVTSGTDLTELIAHGDGVYRVDYYDDRRWTERPERYVRDTLGRTLFEACGFQRAVTGIAPTLDVQLLKFQEVTTPSTHAVRIALRVTLSKERAIFDDTVAITEPVVGPRFEDVIGAMGRALDGVAVLVAQRVEAAPSTP